VIVATEGGWTLLDERQKRIDVVVAWHVDDSTGVVSPVALVRGIVNDWQALESPYGCIHTRSGRLFKSIFDAALADQRATRNTGA
jgi:hypothetical protein